MVGALAASFWGVKILALSYAVISVVNFFIYHYFIRKSHGYKYIMLVKDTIPVLLTTLGVLLLMFFVTKAINSIYMKFAVTVVVSAILYVFIMYIIKFDSFEEIKKHFKEAI